jgi:hypothetical protein
MYEAQEETISKQKKGRSQGSADIIIHFFSLCSMNVNV